MMVLIRGLSEPNAERQVPEHLHHCHYTKLSVRHAVEEGTQADGYSGM